MKLEKAIEILSEEVKHPYSAKRMARPDAIKLGIEAMKKWQVLREGRLGIIDPLLPSETEE